MPRYSIYVIDNRYFIRYGALRTTLEYSSKTAFECVLKDHDFVFTSNSNHMKSTLLFSCDSYQDAVDHYPEYFI